MKLEFSIIFPNDVKIVSVNQQYELKRSRTGKIVGFYLNPEVGRMMWYIQKSLKDQGFCKENITNDWGMLRVSYVFIFKQNIWKRDVDNCCKHAQDAIFRFFGRNDSTILELTARKYINPGATFESMLCSIESLGFDQKIYNIDVAAQSISDGEGLESQDMEFTK